MAGVRKTIGESSWFVRDRFGMFIHWGLYSLAAPETLTLELPVQRPHVTVPVIELFMK